MNSQPLNAMHSQDVEESRLNEKMMTKETKAE